jgi:hypothetical protein
LPVQEDFAIRESVANRGMNMQPRVRFTFPREDSALIVKKLFEYRDGEAAPKPFAIRMVQETLPCAGESD